MLTKKQKNVLDYVRVFTSKNKYAPSLDEIRRRFRLASVSTAHFHIKKLQKLGFLKKESGKSRAIDIIKQKHLMDIPLIGMIAAGTPFEAVETLNETITLPKEDLPFGSKLYALRVAGDSMTNEGIFNGDTVIIKQQSYASNGETVVAIIDENEATLKKFYRENNRIRLQPANHALLPIYRKDVEIRGIVVKVIRNFDSAPPENYNQLVAVDFEKKPNSPIGESIFLNSKLKLNNIYNSDCLELMRNIKSNTIDLIFADPPYNLSKSNFKIKFVKSGGADLNTNKGSWDKFDDNEFEVFTKKWLSESFRILKPNGAIWVAGSYHNIYLTGYLMKKIGYEILNEILWHKSDATPNLSCTRFVADHENFIWARKGKGNIFNYGQMKNLNNGKQMRSIWTRGKTAGGKKIHPTQKPEWLLERIILATSNPKNIVFDPFIGSGTTAVVSKKLNRQFLGTEIDEGFFNKAQNRLDTICQNIN